MSTNTIILDNDMKNFHKLRIELQYFLPVLLLSSIYLKKLKLAHHRHLHIYVHNDIIHPWCSPIDSKENVVKTHDESVGYKK